MQYYSADNLAGDAFMKVCETRPEPLTEKEHLDLAEKFMHCGMSSFYSSRVLLLTIDTSASTTKFPGRVLDG